MTSFLPNAYKGIYHKPTRVTDEGWYSQKQLPSPVEQKNKEKTPVSSYIAYTVGLVSYRPFTVE